MGQAFGRNFLIPLLADFLARYPRVLPDWHFENRQVDIVGEGFDAAIGGGFPLAAGVVARELATIHIVAVASPGYLAGRALPRGPDDLASFDGVMRRSSPTGRVRPWVLRSRRSAEQAVPCRPRLILSDPEAVAQAARLGLGVALLPMPFAFIAIASGELVRLLPGWYADAGPLSLYYPSRRMLPAKTRVFVDFVVERFRSAGFERLVDGAVRKRGPAVSKYFFAPARETGPYLSTVDVHKAVDKRPPPRASSVWTPLVRGAEKTGIHSRGGPKALLGFACRERAQYSFPPTLIRMPWSSPPRASMHAIAP